MTQEQIAEAASMSRSYLANIELNRRGQRLGARLLHRLAAALNVSTEWLLTGKGPKRRQA